MTRNPNTNVANAFRAFITSKNLTVRGLSRILAEHSRDLDKVKAGHDPGPRLRAKIYIMTNDETFKPRNPKDQVVLADIKKNLPPSLKQYLENGAVPAPPARKGSSEKEAPKPVTDSSLTTLLLTLLTDGWVAGAIERADQNRDGLRFVLTSESFKPIRTTIGDQEIEDTKKLIRELRRRFNLFAQIIDQEMRAKLAKELTREVEELSMAMILLKEVIPTEAAKRLEHLRASLNGLAIPTKKKEKT